MKKKFVLFIIFSLFCFYDASAQGVVSVFRSDCLNNEFLIEDIDSIVCIYEGNTNTMTSTYDTQVVYTKYGIFKVPLNLVDSVSLQQPLANAYALSPDVLGDWDEGYVYKSVNNDDMSVACTIKHLGDETLMYLNNLYTLINFEEGFIFVMGNDGYIKHFLHSGIYFSLTYDNSDISIQGIDSLGNEVFNQKISQLLYASSYKKSRQAISLDNIKNGYDIFSKIFNGLDMANMVGKGAWKEFFYSLFKTGIDMSKNLKIGIPIKVMEIAYQIVSYDMRSQLYRSCKVNVDNVVKNSSNSANVTLNIQNASSLSYIYYETETHYNYMHTEYENPYTYTTVPHMINQYYSGIVVKKNHSDVSYGDYDIRLPLKTINKTTSTTNLNLTGLGVGEKYYIKPYIIADMLLSDDDFWDFLDGGILYGPVYEYVFNGISVDFNQTSCTYLGNNKMGLSYNLSAEIATSKDVNAWGVVVKDENGKEIKTYYAESGSSILAIDEHMIINRDIFNSDNIAEIKLCPFYIYGYYATPVYLESVDKQIEWKVLVETKEALSVDESTEDINCYVEGFDMNDFPNDCAIGILYRNTPGLSIDNSNVAISDQKSSGDLTVTLRELESGKEYYYKAYVRIEDNYYYGDEKNFATYPSNEDSPDAVDLGLSVKWANYNVGAKKPEEIGGYFAWGETKPKTNFTNYDYYYFVQNEGYVVTKYNSSDGLEELLAEDDAAHTYYGGHWRMPTIAELEELRMKCYWVSYTLNGIFGYMVYADNGNSIFLPAGGGYDQYTSYETLNSNETNGHYNGTCPVRIWTKSLYRRWVSNYTYAYSGQYVNYNGNDGWIVGYDYRKAGLNIRPVYDPNY